MAHISNDGKCCPLCGEPVAAEHTFCRNCGAVITEENASEENVSKENVSKENAAGQLNVEQRIMLKIPLTGPVVVPGPVVVDGEPPADYSAKSRPLVLIAIIAGLFILAPLAAYYLTSPYWLQRRLKTRQRECLVNMKSMLEAINLWEMKQEEEKFAGGGDCEIDTHSMAGQSLVPDYIKEIPRCRQSGKYRYHASSHTVWCTRHNSPEKPMDGTSAAPGP